MEKVKKNYVYTIAYQILTIGIPLIITPYISRTLGADNVGIYSYSYSITQYFMLFAMLGISDHGNRIIAGKRDSKEELSKSFWSIYRIQLCASVSAVLIFIVFIIFSENNNKEVLSVTLFFILSALLDINWFFWGIENFKLTVTRNFFIKILSLIAIFLFVKGREDLLLYTVIMSVSALVSNMCLWFFLIKEVSIVHIRWQDCLKHLKPCIILFIPLVARSVFVYMDKIMLGQMSTMTQTGFYDYSEKIILMPTSLLTSLGTVMLPRVSYMKEQRKDSEILKVINKSMFFVIMCGCAFTFGIAAVAEDLAPIFLGSEYYDCGKIMELMSVTILLVAWTNVIRTHYLIPCRKDSVFVIAVVLGAITNFFVNYCFIPKYGAIGAVYGWLAAEVVITLYQTIFSYHALPIKHYLNYLLIFMGLGMLMYIIVKYVQKKMDCTISVLILEIMVGIGVYLIGCMLLYLIKTIIQKLNQIKK